MLCCCFLSFFLRTGRTSFVINKQITTYLNVAVNIFVVVLVYELVHADDDTSSTVDSSRSYVQVSVLLWQSFKFIFDDLL